MKVFRVRIPATFLVLAISLAACSDLTSTVPLGKLSAQVVDAAGAGVPNVEADLYKLVEGGAILWRASSTSSSGVAVFGASDGGVVPGNYYIHIRFTTFHTLASGETNDKTVTVREGDDLNVIFHAVSGGGPSGP